MDRQTRRSKKLAEKSAEQRILDTETCGHHIGPAALSCLCWFCPDVFLNALGMVPQLYVFLCFVSCVLSCAGCQETVFKTLNSERSGQKLEAILSF